VRAAFCKEQPLIKRLEPLGELRYAVLASDDPSLSSGAKVEGLGHRVNGHPDAFQTAIESQNARHVTPAFFLMLFGHKGRCFEAKIFTRLCQQRERQAMESSLQEYAAKE
jgi:hypothetical protein